MKKILLTALLALVSIYWLNAQNEPWTNPCGSPQGKSEWLKKYQQNPQAHYRNSDTALYVPLTIHILGNDEGAGYFTTNKLLDALCKLNADFEEANIIFFVEGEVQYINNSAWYDHDSVLIGAEMMFANNVDNTIKTYFVSEPAGNCAYNLPYAGIAMKKSCSDANEFTWAHEVGHNLSIPHPFLGWEGGVSHDNSVPYNYNDPAPPFVTYDYTYFKDTLITDTTIIDTAWVELLDGSNCQSAADGFCDTSPDYLAFRWFCDGNAQSQQQQTDPTGAHFRSDGTLIMGYAEDACQARFTPEQIAAMRANLYEEKAGYLYNQTPAPPVSSDPPTLNFPLDEEVVQFDGAYLEWEPVENATHYVIQVSLLPNFNSALVKEHFSTEPYLLIEDLLNNRTYYWRVRAYNSHSFCTTPSDSRQFQTGNLVQANTIEGVSAPKVFPNPAGSEANVALELQSTHAFAGALQWRSATGQLFFQKAVEIQSGNNHLEMATSGIPAGLYLLWLESPRGRLVKRVVVR